MRKNKEIEMLVHGVTHTNTHDNDKESRQNAGESTFTFKETKD